MDEKTIKEALVKGERVTLECKRAKTEVPKELKNLGGYIVDRETGEEGLSMAGGDHGDGSADSFPR